MPGMRQYLCGWMQLTIYDDVRHLHRQVALSFMAKYIHSAIGIRKVISTATLHGEKFSVKCDMFVHAFIYVYMREKVCVQVNSNLYPTSS